MQPTPPAGPRGARRVRGGNAEEVLPPRPYPGSGKFRRGAPAGQGRGGQGRAALSIQRVYRGHVGRWAARMAIVEITDAMQYEPAPEPDEEDQDWGGEGTLSGGWRVEAERYAGTDDEEEAAERSRVSQPGGNPGANLKSISHTCHPILVAFVWELFPDLYKPGFVKRSKYWWRACNPHPNLTPRRRGSSSSSVLWSQVLEGP